MTTNDWLTFIGVAGLLMIFVYAVSTAFTEPRISEAEKKKRLDKISEDADKEWRETRRLHLARTERMREAQMANAKNTKHSNTRSSGSKGSSHSYSSPPYTASTSSYDSGSSFTSSSSCDSGGGGCF